MIGRYFRAMVLLVLVSTTSEAQQFQIQPGSAAPYAEQFGSAADIDVSINPNMEVRDFDVDMKDQPELYEIDQWSYAEPERHLAGTFDMLVYVYDVPLPWDPTMIERVRQAKVVDEEATFPLPVRFAGRCRGVETVKRRGPDPTVFVTSLPERNQSDRYSDLPQGEEPFVILDLAESEHLGMVPGSWRP
ncbi:hypothetical protein [Aeoliella sp. SH292]|uniref:hypothetical protein n=1 Tax=Aeoliella sp. SH292 TaxID=3454464 RepID=UPI003F97F883